MSANAILGKMYGKVGLRPMYMETKQEQKNGSIIETCRGIAFQNTGTVDILINDYMLIVAAPVGQQPIIIPVSVGDNNFFAAQEFKIKFLNASGTGNLTYFVFNERTC